MMIIPFPVIHRFRRRDGAPAILLVRDETDVRRATWYAYAATGGRVIEAATGGEAGTWCPPGSDVVESAMAQAEDRHVSRWYASHEPAKRPSDAEIRLRWMAATAIGRPESEEFFSVCGSTAARALCYPGGEMLLRLLDDRCGPHAVDAFFERYSFLFHELIDKATRNPDGVAEAILSDRSQLAARLTSLIAMPEHGPDQAAYGTAMARLLKRLDGADMPQLVRVNYMLWLACYVPADWLPTPAACDDFGAVAMMARLLVTSSKGGLSATTLVASAKGRWDEFRRRTQPRHGIVSDATDMWQAFRNQVAEPALRHHLTFGIAAAEMSAVQRHALRGPFEADRDAIDAYCSRLLLGAKSLPAMADTAAQWHAAQAAMDGVICKDQGATWPVPFDRVELDGFALVAIGDSAALRTEGAELQHCVGGYMRRCMENDCVIASLVRVAPDGTESRSSTVELSGWSPGKPWRPEIRQHRGLRNKEPEPDEAAALAGLVGRLRAAPDAGDGIGTLDHGRTEFAPYGYDWTDPEALAEAFRQWIRFMPAETVSRGTLWFLDQAEELAGGAEKLEALRHRISVASKEDAAAGDGQMF